MKDDKESFLRRRTIRLSDVVKALEIAAERLGDPERSCATLRAWADAGRVTPSGQVLSPEAVDAGIKAWMAKRKGAAGGGAAPLSSPKGPPKDSVSERRPATPQNGKGSPAASPRGFLVQTSGNQTAPPQAPPAPAAQAAAVVEPSAVTSEPPSAVEPPEAPKPAAKRQRTVKRQQRTQTYEESKEERARAAAELKNLARARLEDVLEEMTGHMEEILRRTGEEALSKWRTAGVQSDAERRELYVRLVHAVQDPDVRSPEELNAELLPHQVEGLEWLASLYANGLHGILADEMGLGKTIQTIALLLHIQERKGNNGPHLIVAPKSCLSNWEAEFARFAPNFSVHVLTGDVEEREAGIAAFKKAVEERKPAACVTNYEQVHRNEYLSQTSWQLIVVDEGHRLKNPETVLHNAMKQLKCRMRLLLTGTPLQNSLNELWALLHYLLPDLFTCMMDFKSWFANPFKGVPGINEYDVQLQPEQEQKMILRMHSLLSPFLLQRLKADALADRLPPRVEMTVRVPLSAWQSVAYAELEKKTISLLGDDDSVTSEQVNNALMQLRKIALHPYLFNEDFPRDENLFRASGKMEALDRLLSKLLKFDHKVLIFSQFTTVLDIIEAYLRWKDINSVRLDGQVAHEQRRERIERFNTDKSVSVFLLSARAGGLGLNLQAADTVVLFDLDWNPQNDKQAIARVHRVGQTREVRVIRLVTDTPVERHMEERCREKLEMEQKIMGAGMFRRQATHDQRRQALRAVLSLGSGEASEPAAGAEGAALTPLEEVNTTLARGSEELAAFALVDATALKPQAGAAAAAADAVVAGGTEANSVRAKLLRCGRLMRPTEVPAGFSGFRCEDD